MSRIGFLIPEFPAQTHAFFIRERAELAKLGVDTVLVSTRRPVAGTSMAHHDWAKDAAKETTYLFPLSKREIFKAFLAIVFAGPLAWFRCLAVVIGPSDMGMSERAKMFAMMLAGGFLKNLCKRNNLTHVHVHSCANSANVAMFSRLIGGPSYSLTLHGPLQDYGTNQARKWANAAFCIVITKELIEEVNTALSDSQIPPVYLAPMGVNIDDFKRSTIYSPVKAGEKIKLVSCGRLNYVKGHDDLIRAVATLKEEGYAVELNICGATDTYSEAENYFDVLKDLRMQLGVEEEVNFLGSVSEARVKEELESAHFFCLASLKEPLGVATMEAMAMEIPAIVTRSPGVSEMVETGVDGILVEPRSPDQFVKEIKRLVDAPEEAMDLAYKGRLKVVQQYHSGISAARIAEGVENTL